MQRPWICKDPEVPSAALVAVAALAGCGRVGFDAVAAIASPDGGAPDGGALDGPAAIVASFEAEAAQLTAPFAIAGDLAASSGQYLVDDNPMGTTGPGQALATFAVDASAMYYIWGRTRSPDASTDSFFVSVDGGADGHYNTSDCVHSPQWHWAAVRTQYTCPALPPVLGFALGAGTHSLRLRSREGQSAVDRFVIVDDPGFVPTD